MKHYLNACQFISSQLSLILTKTKTGLLMFINCSSLNIFSCLGFWEAFSFYYVNIFAIMIWCYFLQETAGCRLELESERRQARPSLCGLSNVSSQSIAPLDSPPQATSPTFGKLHHVSTCST